MIFAMLLSWFLFNKEPIEFSETEPNLTSKLPQANLFIFDWTNQLRLNFVRIPPLNLGPHYEHNSA